MKIPVRLGDKVQITGAQPEQPEAPAPATTPRGARKGVLPVDVETPRYLPRVAAEITFYDLGTRLRSCPPTTIFDRLRTRDEDEQSTPRPRDGYYNEYVEMRLEASGDNNDPATGYRDVILRSDQERIDKRYLGSRIAENNDPLDPFGAFPANGSMRPIPVCLQLPFASQDLWVDLILYNSNTEKKFVIGEKGTRPEVSLLLDAESPPAGSDAWKQKKVPLDSERWNPLNVADVATPGALSCPAGEWNARVDARAFYHSFDTGDVVNFKVTRDPRFEAERVPFAIGKGARIYLTPRTTGIVLYYEYRLRCVADSTRGENPMVLGAYFFARLPIYPRTGKLILATKTADENLTSSLAALIERSRLFLPFRTVAEAQAQSHASATCQYLTGSSSIFELNTPDEHARAHALVRTEGEYLLRAGKLVAGIVTGNQVFYVWRATDTTSPEDYTTYRIDQCHPALPTVPIDN